jgi:MFS family permease
MASRGGADFIKGFALIGSILSVCSTGNFLFGYDQGVMSGVVISKPWLADMGHPSTLMIGTITALYDVGAAAGAIAAAFTGEHLGRKYTLMLGTVIQMIGSILLGVSYERVQFMVGRVVTGK